MILKELKGQVALAKTTLERDKTKVDLTAQGNIMKARELIASIELKLESSKEGMEKAA